MIITRFDREREREQGQFLVQEILFIPKTIKKKEENRKQTKETEKKKQKTEKSMS